MGKLLGNISFLGVVMGFLALTIGYLTFIFGINTIKWVAHKNEVSKDAIGFSLTLGVASLIIGVAWPIFLFSQGYQVVAVLIFLSEALYIIYRISGLLNRS